MTAGHTPLIQQYLDIKAGHPDALLFFRVGDFYEMFFEDAEEGSGLLGLTLTSRNNGGSGKVPLAGVPAKAADEYVSRLLRLGRRVAICEQVEDPAQAEGLVRREVVEVITPGTVLEDTLLAEKRNNWVASLAGSGPVGVAAVDLSTGEFEMWSCDRNAVADELNRFEPAELLVAVDGTAPSGPWTITRRDAWRFDAGLGHERMRRRFGVRSVDGFGLSRDADSEIIAAGGALLEYLEEVRPAGLSHLRLPRVERRGRYMHLDAMTRRNLELVETIRRGEGVTLLELIDVTRTAMGGRLLRRRLLQPLVEREAIEARLGAVEDLFDDDARRRQVREALGEVRDLERLAARASAGRILPRELLALGRSLERIPAVLDAAGAARSERLVALLDGLDPLEDVRDRIERTLNPDGPTAVKDGGVIRMGVDARLDELRASRASAVDWIAELQVRERERTGVDSLKVGYNKVFGYYLEVTKANIDRVPDDYVRKQTLSNAERYLTPELKEYEARVLGADDEIAVLEARLFDELRETVATEAGRIQETAAAIAELDVHAALAEVARREDWVRPELLSEPDLEIRAGRHPVVERSLSRGEFIPNDVVLDDALRVMLVTGPNMAGKSTVLRQVGLIVLLAQTGAFVPAARARVGLCDRILTRVGASDNLAAGMSTFFVEMSETALILNCATRRSLVLLDEIGRGTSTYDGVSIAWAVTERLHEIDARTIFATHYHELVELADMLPSVEAYNVAVREAGEEIVFQHRLQPGGSDRSYGLHVGRLAGLPPEVVRRAAEILHGLENGPSGAGSRVAGAVDGSRGQLSLFEPLPSKTRRMLEELDPDGLTPLEALNRLAVIKAVFEDEA